MDPQRPLILLTFAFLLVALAACSTPYGGPGGCLVVGKGNCTTDGNATK